MSAGIDKLVVPGVFSLDGRLRRREQRLAGRERRRGARHRRAPCRRTDRRGDRRPDRDGDRARDHVTAAALREATGGPLWFHPADPMLWDVVHPGAAPDRDLAEGVEFPVAGATLQALHTPGHSPGSTCLHAPDLGTVFTGDTLFCGGPGATGRSYSDHPTILESIRTRLLTLPPETVVRTGHGKDTTVGAEVGNVP